MPELPEVQAVVDYLNQLKLAKKHISSIESPNKYEPVFHNSSLLEFNHFLKNKIIENIQRRGKFIIFNLNSGYLLFHLRMTGQLTNELSNQSDIKYVSITINSSLNQTPPYFLIIFCVGLICLKLFSTFNTSLSFI